MTPRELDVAVLSVDHLMLSGSDRDLSATSLALFGEDRGTVATRQALGDLQRKLGEQLRDHEAGESIEVVRDYDVNLSDMNHPLYPDTTL